MLTSPGSVFLPVKEHYLVLGAPAVSEVTQKGLSPEPNHYLSISTVSTSVPSWGYAKEARRYVQGILGDF